MAADEAELKSLMVASLEGEAVPYRKLLVRLSSHLRAYLRTRLLRAGRSAAEAEDLLQEVLLAIHTRRHTYDSREPFTPWLYAITRYKLIDHLRHTKGYHRDVSLEDALDIVSEVDEQGDTESALDVNRLLSLLPEKTRCAIEHVKLRGLSVAEAAERCGMSESAVKVSIHRGLKRLALSIAREKGS